jgi:hypothetical protein
MLYNDETMLLDLLGVIIKKYGYATVENRLNVIGEELKGKLPDSLVPLNKIGRIKLVRKQMGCNLRDAKTYVETMFDNDGKGDLIESRRRNL